MIKHDVHWEPVKQFFMRNNLIGGPMELHVPAKIFDPRRNGFDHVERGRRVLWRVEGETNATNALRVESGKRGIIYVRT